MVYLCYEEMCFMLTGNEKLISGNSVKNQEAVSRWHSNGPNVRFESTGRWQSDSDIDILVVTEFDDWRKADQFGHSVWNGLEHRSTFVYSSHIQRAFAMLKTNGFELHPISKGCRASMTTDHLQEICKEIQRGEKSLAASEKLFQAGLMEDAISRSYYAVLHAAGAILCIGLRPWI